MDNKVRSNMKPNEVWFLCKVSKEYFDYPIKEMFTQQFYIEVEDQINNQNLIFCVTK